MSTKNMQIIKLKIYNYIKMRKIFTFFGKLIKSNDRFSTPISLNYLGETSYKTVIGGLSSIAIGISLL